MDIQFEKLEIIKLLMETENPSVIQSIKKVFQKEQKDWYDELPNYVKEGIAEGLEDLKQGKVVSYDDFKTQFNLKL